MNRGDVFWADLGPPAGRRPVVVLTRTSALHVRTRITVAPVSTNIRGIASEIRIGVAEGLPRSSAAQCDDIMTIPKDWLLGGRVGRLSRQGLTRLDTAICYALGIAWSVTDS